jgi:hypothetical protein
MDTDLTPIVRKAIIKIYMLPKNVEKSLGKKSIRSQLNYKLLFLRISGRFSVNMIGVKLSACVQFEDNTKASN